MQFERSSTAPFSGDEIVSGRLLNYFVGLFDGNGAIQPTERISAAFDGETALLNFDKIDAVACLESELFSYVSGEGDATVEGDHCGGHLEPLQLL
jgi:hypothetical protein